MEFDNTNMWRPAAFLTKKKKNHFERNFTEYSIHFTKDHTDKRKRKMEPACSSLLFGCVFL